MWNFEGVTFFSKETYVFVVYWPKFLNVSSQIMAPAIYLCWNTLGLLDNAGHGTTRSAMKCKREEDCLKWSWPRDQHTPHPQHPRLDHRKLLDNLGSSSSSLKRGSLWWIHTLWKSKLTIFSMVFSLKAIVLVVVCFINNCRGLFGFSGLLDFQGKYDPLLLGSWPSTTHNQQTP